MPALGHVTPVRSMRASCHLSASFASSMDRNFRQTSIQTHCSSQSLNRRYHADRPGYQSGRSYHGAPVLSTQRMPSNTMWLSAGGRPPFGFCSGAGTIGSSIFHLLLFMKRVTLAIGHLPIAYYTKTQETSRIEGLHRTALSKVNSLMHRNPGAHKKVLSVEQSINQHPGLRCQS